MHSSQSQENSTLPANRLGHNLSELIKQHGLNISQLAQLLDVPIMTIRRLITGETSDPRLSTLKIIADYFNVSIDDLVNSTIPSFLIAEKKSKPCIVPKINWDSLTKIANTPLSMLTQQWESIFLTQATSEQSFALDSKPSLYPRFPRGTVFVIDPEVLPKDGDIVLIRFKENNEFMLKELFIDPPQWYLSSLVADALRIDYDSHTHEIMGTVVMTLLCNSRVQGE